MNELFDRFCEFFEEYVLLEELHKYATQLVLPVGENLRAGSCGFPVDPNYPITGLMVEYVNLVMKYMVVMSPSFVEYMVAKHR